MSNTPETDAHSWTETNRANSIVSASLAQKMEIELREAYQLIKVLSANEQDDAHYFRARKWLGRNERFNPDNYTKKENQS